jgi:predicted nucleotidyltransferase
MLNFAEIKNAVIEVAQAQGACQAMLFGSYARGTATARSDVDLVFVEETQAPFLARSGKYLEPLFDRLQTSVDALVYSPREFAQMQDGPFMRRVLREGIVLYESGKISD